MNIEHLKFTKIWWKLWSLLREKKFIHIVLGDSETPETQPQITDPCYTVKFSIVEWLVTRAYVYDLFFNISIYW